MVVVVEWEDIARIPNLAVGVSPPQLLPKPQTERVTIEAMCSADLRARRIIRSVIWEQSAPSMVVFLKRAETAKLRASTGECAFESQEVQWTNTIKTNDYCHLTE